MVISTILAVLRSHIYLCWKWD